MKPINEAWAFLKALPEDEVVQNRWRPARGNGVHAFLDAQGKPTGHIKYDLPEQLRIQTRHPALNPSRHIESVNGRLTNTKLSSGLTPTNATEILRYPTTRYRGDEGWSETGQERGLAEREIMLQQKENEEWQDKISMPVWWDTQRRILRPQFGYRGDGTPNIGQLRPSLPQLSDEEMQNLRQQAEQMPFSYEE